MTDAGEAERLRAEQREVWEAAAAGWERRAGTVADWGRPVSVWLIDHLHLRAGQTLLELAAGVEPTGFLAAQQLRPGGTLIASDGAEAMVAAARRSAAALGIDNVEFKVLELEWIDLPAASVDAALCRWGLMLTVDPAAATREVRRVLRPGGRFTLAVWTRPEENPWMTVARQAMSEAGHLEPPGAGAPGAFALAGAERLETLLADAGFFEIELDTVDLVQRSADVYGYLEATADFSPGFGRAWGALDAAQREQVHGRVSELAAPYLEEDGRLALPGRSLVAVAEA